MGFYGILWDFVGFYGDLLVIHGFLMEFYGIYPLVSSNMAGWKIPGFWMEVSIARKITDFYGPFSRSPCLMTPEGIRSNISPWSRIDHLAKAGVLNVSIFQKWNPLKGGLPQVLWAAPRPSLPEGEAMFAIDAGLRWNKNQSKLPWDDWAKLKDFLVMLV